MPSFRKKPVDHVIDVRSRIEFFFGHLPGAFCIPVDALAAGLKKHPGVTADSRILVYCASGARSAVAAAQLKQMGYRRVVDGGGLSRARAEFEEG
jgi:rhodanese-related sulfurtransferase